MAKSLNILHLLLILGGGLCIRFAWQETKDKIVKSERLLWAPLTALVAALVLMFIQLSTKQAAWPFAAAFIAGFAIGGVSGLIIALKFDGSWRVLRPPGMRVQLWIASTLAAAVAVDIVGVASGPPGLVWRVPATLAAMACAGMLVGRAIAMAARVRRLVG